MSVCKICRNEKKCSFALLFFATYKVTEKHAHVTAVDAGEQVGNTVSHEQTEHKHTQKVGRAGSFSHTYILIPDVGFPFTTCAVPQAPPTASRAPLSVHLQSHAGDFSEEGE